MPYIGNDHAHSALYARERDLLLSGLSYAEIAEQTGQRARTVSERNRVIHKVNIYDAFAERIRREGMPTRMPTDMLSLAWLVGILDGEGSFIVFTRACTGRPQYSEFRLGVRVQVRADDRGIITAIRDITGVGRIADHIANGRTNVSVSWACEKINDLAEVIVPILDTIPLRSKKAREYAVWQPLVIRRYLDTMGGYSNRLGVSEEYRAAFQSAIEAIADIRTFPVGVGRAEIQPESAVVPQDAAHISADLH